MEDTLFPVRKQLEAYNKGDLERYMSCFTQDVEVLDSDGNITMNGAEAMRESYARLFAAYPNQHCEILSRIAVGSFVIDEERITGRAEGQELKCAAVYKVENGLICRVQFLR